MRICQLDRLCSYFSQSVCLSPRSHQNCFPRLLRLVCPLAAPPALPLTWIWPLAELGQVSSSSLEQVAGVPPWLHVPVATAGGDPQHYTDHVEEAYVRHILQQTVWE